MYLPALATILIFVFVAVGIAVLTLIVKALRKYLKSKEVRAEKELTQRTLGEVLFSHRTRCKMTQEFVAETIGVSRQAVSKWENETSDPSTANLIALAKLYRVKADELVKEVSEN